MIELRPATEAEMGQLGGLGGYVYGGTFGDGPDSLVATATRPEWTLCAFDGGRLVSSFATIPFTMRMAGRPVALGGVSAVGTRPDHRRRGLVRQLMTQATADMRHRGQPIAALWASQAAIYQRYGYAIGSYQRSYTIDGADIAFFDGDTGSRPVEMVEPDGARDALKALYIEFIAGRTGYLHRSRSLWDNGVFAPDPADGPVRVALALDGDRPVGSIVYTLRGDRVDHRARAQELRIRDLCWLDVDAYRSLWRYVAGHDLVGRVRWSTAPVDDPAPELFTEPRLLHVADEEGIWFRVVDAERALTDRGYRTGGHATITVVGDELTPWNEGTFAVESDGMTTEVTRVDGEGDVTVTVKALASLYTGLRPARQLRAWGLLDGDDVGVDRVDALFATAHAPHCPDHF